MPKTLLHILLLYFIPIHENTIVNTTTINVKAENESNQGLQSAKYWRFLDCGFHLQKD